MDPPFKTGDRVRLKTGNSLIIVLETDFFETNKKPIGYVKRRWKSRYKKQSLNAEWFIRFTYQSSMRYEEQWREADDFVFYDEQSIPLPGQLKKEEIMDVLYQTQEDKPRFGIHRGVNGNGEFILEMKGKDGDYEAFAQNKIDEVLPYTVELTELRVDPQCKPRSIHVLAQKGQVEKADVMLELNSGIFWRVTKPDSKCRSPHGNKSKWMKVPLTPITFGE